MEPKKRILIVDDEETIAWGISKTLAQSDLGVETFYTTRATEALAMVNKEKYDLVITDIRMPDMSGIDLLKEVKEKYPDVGVVIMTAYGSTEVQQEASKRGSIFYIEKPFDIKVLKKVISEFFSKKNQTQDPTPAGEASDQFDGSLGSLQLMDVVQMNCLGRITCTLKITDGSKDGLIVFKKGDIVHAETPGMVGKEAFFNIAGWKGGSFDMLDEIPNQVTILDHWEQLLIEALQVLDDGSTDAVAGDDFDFDFGQPPSGTTLTQQETEVAPSAPVSPVEAAGDFTPNTENAEDTSNLLDRMVKTTHAEAAFIMTPDGFVIDRRINNEGLQIEASGANISKTMTSIIALAETMKSGKMDRILMTFTDKYIVVKATPKTDLLFVLALPISTQIEPVLHLIEKEAKNLTDLI